MNRFLKTAVMAGIAAVTFANVQASENETPPDYVLLRAPRATTSKHATRGFYPGRGYEATAHTYAYGWFGVKPRRHWSRHHGYYRNYTQWSKR